MACACTGLATAETFFALTVPAAPPWSGAYFALGEPAYPDYGVPPIVAAQAVVVYPGDGPGGVNSIGPGPRSFTGTMGLIFAPGVSSFMPIPGYAAYPRYGYFDARKVRITMDVNFKSARIAEMISYPSDSSQVLGISSVWSIYHITMDYVGSGLGMSGGNLTAKFGLWQHVAELPAAPPNPTVHIADATVTVEMDKYWRFSFVFNCASHAGDTVNNDGCLLVSYAPVEGGSSTNALSVADAPISVNTRKTFPSMYQGGPTDPATEMTLPYYDQGLLLYLGHYAAPDVAHPLPPGLPCYYANISLQRLTCPSDPPTIPSDSSSPCCGSGADPGDGPTGGGTTPGATPPPDTTIPLPPWTRMCAGGGTVPTADSITDSENWAS